MDSGLTDSGTAIKRFEDMLQLLFTDAESLVLHCKFDLADMTFILYGPGRDAQPRLLATILHGICNEILHALHQGVEVAADHGQSVLHAPVYCESRRGHDACCPIQGGI